MLDADDEREVGFAVRLRSGRRSSAPFSATDRSRGVRSFSVILIGHIGRLALGSWFSRWSPPPLRCMASAFSSLNTRQLTAARAARVCAIGTVVWARLLTSYVFSCSYLSVTMSTSVFRVCIVRARAGGGVMLRSGAVTQRRIRLASMEQRRRAIFACYICVCNEGSTARKK